MAPPDLLLDAAYLILLLIALRTLQLMLSGDVAWRDLMAQSNGSDPTAHRPLFLFGHIGMALVFLLSVLKFDGDNMDVLANATRVLFDFDYTTASGAVSAYYVWGKLKKGP